MIKRSSRKGELKEAFRVKQMSSISTLSLCGRINRCGRDGGTKQIREQVAETNKLELLKWAREEKKCEWDDRTIDAAAYQGNLEMVKYCVANQCPKDEWACAFAASQGHLECLKYFTKKSKRPGILGLPLRLQMAISTYSNILSSVSIINIAKWLVRMQQGSAT